MESAIQRFIAHEIMFSDGKADIDVNQSLLSSGILDSLSLIKVVLFVQEEFGVTVDDEEVIPENFETIGAIKSLVDRKLQAA